MSNTILGSVCPLTCDLGRRNLTLVRDTPSHYVLSFCEVSLNLLWGHKKTLTTYVIAKYGCDTENLHLYIYFLSI